MARLGLIMAAAMGTAIGGSLIGAPALASAGPGRSPDTVATPSSAPECPSTNPPNQMTLLAGTPQTTPLGSPFATGMQVTLSNNDGCAVTSAAGIPVTFNAPAGGASGVFSASATDTAIVGADATGTASAPRFTANATAGSYTVTASSQYGSISFSLTNTAAGIPASIVAIPLTHRSAAIMNSYPEPLQVRVLDSGGNPVSGATVTFTLGSGGSGTCDTSTSTSTGASASASATFPGAGTQASATTGASGVASSPLLSANETAGSFTATAAVSGNGTSAGSGKEDAGAAGGQQPTPVSFALANRAGRPAKLSPGVGATQAAPAGSRFAIRLAVTVTDAQKNLVPGALITFSSPLTGASGRFTVNARGPRHRIRVSHPHTVKVRTDGCGVAVAPAFTANHAHGGYIVKADVKHTRGAAFALVNNASGRSS